MLLRRPVYPSAGFRLRITPISDHGIDLLSTDLVRTPGLHCSDIYSALYRELEPTRYTDAPMNPVMLALGTAWEKHLEFLLIRNECPVMRPEAFVTKEGIGFSPDLIVSNGIMRVGEIKLTFMSLKESLDDPKFSKYHTQAMAYGYHLGTPYARFYVTFVNGVGGWRKPDPQFRMYDVEYTARELQDNWQMLLNFAKRRKML